MKFFSIVRHGFRSIKAKIVERKRLPEVCKLSWTDKLIVLLSVLSGYYVGGKGVLYLESKFLDNDD